MAPTKRHSHQRHGEPKLFQCTGFGDCNMVFTRSEHLARHARKHTGEKPFKCVVPGCERAFSRFDNMVQHTSTHSKQHDKKRAPGKKQNKPKLVKAVTPCIDGSDTNKTNPSKRLEEPFSPLMPSSSPSISSHIALPDSPSLSDMDFYQHQHQRLPSITDSIFYQSPVTPSIDYFPPPSLSSKSMDHHHPTFLPSPKELDLYVDSIPPMSLDYIRSPPTGRSDSCLSTSPYLVSSYSPPLPLCTTDRKLSPMELELPIQDLSVNHGTGSIGVDVTLDEFEALQGLSRLGAEMLAPLTSYFGKSKGSSSPLA